MNCRYPRNALLQPLLGATLVATAIVSLVSAARADRPDSLAPLVVTRTALVLEATRYTQHMLYIYTVYFTTRCFVYLV